VNSKLSYAIAVILSGSSAGLANAAPASEAESSSDMITEITVTAQRRSENAQDVPISIQAMTAETLQQLNVSTFDDYIKFLPNVTTANNGPGQNEVFMRGLSAGSQPSQGSASTGLWPNVAIYLDNQSGQLPNRNLDVYAADLNRIEVLEGPQGTAVRCRCRGGRDPLHHERTEARRDRGERQSRLRSDGPRRSEYRPDGGIESPADRRHHGRARGDLQRQTRRLHRQRAGDVHAQGHRHRHPLWRLCNGVLCRYSGGRPVCNGHSNGLRCTARQPGHQ